MITVGIAVAFIIGALVSWRTLALTGDDFELHFVWLLNLVQECLINVKLMLCKFLRAGIVPCFVLLVGLVFIPESPRWLVGL